MCTVETYLRAKNTHLKILVCDCSGPALVGSDWHVVKSEVDTKNKQLQFPATQSKQEAATQQGILIFCQRPAMLLLCLSMEFKMLQINTLLPRNLFQDLS